jgi:succinyl-CoA synthetase beta subunit
MLSSTLVQLVVKSQVLAGGRGLGKFKNGFQGGVHIVKADKVEETAGNEDWLLSFLNNLMENFYLFIFFGAVFKIFLPFVVCLFVE